MIAAYQLLKLGFTNVSVLKGGFSEWKRNERCALGAFVCPLCANHWPQPFEQSYMIDSRYLTAVTRSQSLLILQAV